MVYDHYHSHRTTPILTLTINSNLIIQSGHRPNSLVRIRARITMTVITGPVRWKRTSLQKLDCLDRRSLADYRP
jgi:hypothetical protein